MLSMPYANGAGFNREKECLAGTREELLDEITDWINSTEDVPRVYLLSGGAGTGKSSIAHTVARRFDALGRLGSSFCFDATYQAERRPDNVLSTVARDLANHNPQIKRALWKVIHDNDSLRTTRDVAAQFENLILKPTANLTITGPTLIVIDALDESGDVKSRRVLLSLLAKRMIELPDNFRILLTSRPLEDIDKFFLENHIKVQRMDAIDDTLTKRDILAYIRAQLSGSNGRPLEGFGDTQCNLLAESSEGLFQYAYVMCGSITGADGKAGSTPMRRFQRLLGSAAGVRRRGMELLDDLYSKVLHQLLDTNDLEAMDTFRSVMGLIVAALEPLSVDSLCAMRCATNNSSNKSDVTSIVQYMGSLMSGVSDADHSIPIRPLHTSFREFLTDVSRSEAFYVNISDYQQNLALASLRVMRDTLSFNICRLESSYMRNRDIPNLPTLIKHYISPHLSYSCRFWADHLQVTTTFNLTLLGEVKDFLHVRLLFWLETLSLISAVNISPAALSSLMKWSMVCFSHGLIIVYYVDVHNLDARGLK